MAVVQRRIIRSGVRTHAVRVRHRHGDRRGRFETGMQFGSSCSGTVDGYRDVVVGAATPGVRPFQESGGTGPAQTGAHPFASSVLCSCEDQVKFSEVSFDVSAFCLSLQEERQWRSQLWIDRIKDGRLGRTWEKHGMVSEKDMMLMMDAFRSLQQSLFGFHVLSFTEMLAWKWDILHSHLPR